MGSGKPDVPDLPNDPTQSPGEGWEWRGNGPPGSEQGAWHNPQTDQSIHPHRRNNGNGHGPHGDYNDGDKNEGRIYPDGRWEPKK